MEDSFKNAVKYDSDLPASHTDLMEYRDEDSPDLYARIGQMATDAATYTAGGTAGGALTVEGLYSIGVMDALSQSDQMALVLGLPAAGAVLAGRKGFERISEKREESRQRKRNWRRAQELEEVEEDFEFDLASEEYVVVRDHLLGDGEPLERTGESAAALYDEAAGLYDTQYFEEVGARFPGIDYQLSLVDGDQVIRSFTAGEDIVEDAEEAFPDREIASFLRENSESAVSLEEHR